MGLACTFQNICPLSDTGLASQIGGLCLQSESSRRHDVVKSLASGAVDPPALWFNAETKLWAHLKLMAMRAAVQSHEHQSTLVIRTPEVPGPSIANSMTVQWSPAHCSVILQTPWLAEGRASARHDPKTMIIQL